MQTRDRIVRSSHASVSQVSANCVILFDFFCVFYNIDFGMTNGPSQTVSVIFELQMSGTELGDAILYTCALRNKPNKLQFFMLATNLLIPTLST